MSQDHDPQNIDYRDTLNVTRVHNALARENPDLIAESRPVSLWVSLGAIAVAVLGATYFGGNVGVGSSDNTIAYNKFGASYQPNVPAPLVPESTGPVDPKVAGEKVYKNYCQACHQPNGLGVPGTYPPLDGSEWVVESTERLASIISYGVTGPMTVKGAQYGSAFMPPHGPGSAANLSAKDMANLLSFLRGHWSNQASAVTPEEVTEFYARTKGRSALYTESELKEIPQDKMLGAGGGDTAPAAETPPEPPAN